jgi:Protein of unknown function (DUF1190)
MNHIFTFVSSGTLASLVFSICLAVGAVPASAQVSAPDAALSYRGIAECVEGGRLTGEQCSIAFRNARAEYDEKSPRYRARRDCEQVHKTCVVQLAGYAGFSDVSRAAQVYAPGFRGVQLLTVKDGSLSVTPRLEAGDGKIRFKARSALNDDDKVDGRVAVVPDSAARRSSSGGGGGGAYVRRGDRDDTIKTPLKVLDPNKSGESGLFVDKDGVEWYRPARRR